MIVIGQGDSFGNSRDSFFDMTGTTIEDHYKDAHNFALP
jgi:hypothetical protein